MLKNIGLRIRKLRKDKGLTLVEIAERTNIAQATLSRIETGTMTGTIESHEKIAAAIGIGLAELYTGVDSRYEEISHLKKDQDRKVTQHSQNYRLELLTAESSRKKITPLLLTVQNEAKTPVESNERGVEKFLYVLEGELSVHVDQNDYAVKSGETLYFDASLPHFFANPAKSPAKALITVSPSKI